MQVSARLAHALRPETVARGARISIAGAAVDCMFLGLVIAASLLPYVGDLGFYYDDYSVLRRMSLSERRGLKPVVPDCSHASTRFSIRDCV